MSRPAIGIVGTGAVGPAIGRLLHLGGHRVVVAGRHPEKAARAAAFIDPAVDAVSISELPGFATRVIIAVSDTAVREVAERLAGDGFVGTALHTCGALGPDVLDGLRRSGSACGVLHPLQTFPDAARGVDGLAGIGFALAGDSGAVEWGRDIIAALEGFEIEIPPDQLPLYHSAAVLAGNGAIALIDAAVRLMSLAGIDRPTALAGLQPLTRTALDNVFRSGPEAALTGPVVRADAGTIERHAKAMAAGPADVRELYYATGRNLVGIAARRGTSKAGLAEVEKALESFRGEQS